MTRTSIVISLALVIALAGCKAKVVPDPQTQADLELCRKQKLEGEKLIKDVEADNARLMRSKNEVVVTFEGAIVIKQGATPSPGETRPIDDKALTAASQEFMGLFGKSRGAIQKCYEQALKKDTGLQARTVTLSVSASFEPSGQFKTSSFAPSLGEAFDNCIHGVASRWTMSANPPTMTFKAQVSLTPS